MKKKYEVFEQYALMANEPAVAYTHSEKKYEEEDWTSESAPCQYSPDEFKIAIMESLEDIKQGRVYSHESVQRMMMEKVQAWR